MFDSHCHTEDDGAFARARAAGVTGFMLAGVAPAGWVTQAAIAARHTDIYTSVGLHPRVVAEDTDAQCDEAIARIGTPRVIGEIGLDARYPLPRQERAFRAQLAIARGLKVPVILHVVKAHQEALRILRADGHAGGVVHSYTGGTHVPYLALGLSVSLSGTVTFKNASRALQIARELPLDRLLVETDAPDQTPEPHRPAPNEPAFLAAVVGAVARARGLSFEAVAQATAANARRLFQLDGPLTNR
jgi:TatD DNase family protein